MPTVKFSDLWKNHPNISGEKPVLDTKVYDNQCAINLSVALMKSGMNFNSFHGALSWENDKPKYPIRAQELADWLGRTPAGIPFSVKKYKHTELYDQENRESIFEKFPLNVSTGIVFLQNYWGAGRQGDHIDLWDGRRFTDISSWLRIHFNVSWEGRWSNYHNSDAIWFWLVP